MVWDYSAATGPSLFSWRVGFSLVWLLQLAVGGQLHLNHALR